MVPDCSTQPRRPPLGGSSAQRQGAVRVKELSERDRRGLLIHFLGLGPEDRSLRFGAAMSDEAITRYVQMLDFTRDAVFGVYDDDLALSGVGHLAFVPRQALPLLHEATHKTLVAEFGVSVTEQARGLGVGGKLFERAAVHCRNRDVDTLVMHCLASNRVMMHIARRAGMEIHCEYGEANAFLRLPPPGPASVMREAMDEQIASLDYTYKANSRLARAWLRRLPRGGG